MEMAIEFTETIKFQTGRGYTEHGQRIAAGMTDNGETYFVDIDRNISGKINGTRSKDGFHKVMVMHNYDTGNYVDEWWSKLFKLVKLAETV